MGEQKRKREIEEEATLKLERASEGFPSSEVLRDRGVELFVSALASGEVTRPERIAAFLRAEGYLTRPFLFSLIESDRYEAPVTTLLGDLAESTPDEPAYLTGRVWIPLPVQEADGASTTVICRRIVCEVTRDRGFASVAAAEIDRWEEALARLITIVGRIIAEFVPRAEKHWTDRCVRFALEHPANRSRSAEDRSFELAAAVTLISAAFRVPLPPGTVAMGHIGAHGEVEPLGDIEVLRRKCRGLVQSLPTLSMILVARSQLALVTEIIEAVAPSYLKGRMKIIPLGHVDEVFEKIGVSETSFAGVVRPSRFDSAWRRAQNVATVGVGEFAKFRESFLHDMDGGRMVLSGGLAELIALTWYCAAFGINRLEVAASRALHLSDGQAVVGHALAMLIMSLLLMYSTAMLLGTAPARRALKHLSRRETRERISSREHRSPGRWVAIITEYVTHGEMANVIVEQIQLILFAITTWYFISTQHPPILFVLSGLPLPYTHALWMLTWVYAVQGMWVFRSPRVINALFMDREIVGELPGGFVRVGVAFGLVLHLHYLSGAMIAMVGAVGVGVLAAWCIVGRRSSLNLAWRVYQLSIGRRLAWVVAAGLVVLDAALRLGVAFSPPDVQQNRPEGYYAAGELVGAICALLASWLLVERREARASQSRMVQEYWFNFPRYLHWLAPALAAPLVVTFMPPTWLLGIVAVARRLDRWTHSPANWLVSRGLLRFFSLEGVLAGIAMALLGLSAVRVFGVYAARYARVPTYVDGTQVGSRER